MHTSCYSMQTDITSIPFLLQISQDVWNPQQSLSMVQDQARDNDTIYNKVDHTVIK